MGRLVIAHHKSYHPYRADNVERVRRDEEEARLQEAKEEGRLRLADSEARINLLRKRAGIDSNRSRDEELLPEAVKASFNEHRDNKGQASLTDPIQSLMTDGHINLFADLENQEATLKQTVDRSKTRKGKKGEEDDAETDRGYRLAPSEADRKPWYIKSKEEGQTPLDPGKRDRDELRKQRHDPLKEVEASLARVSEPSPSSSSRTRYPMDPPRRPTTSASAPAPAPAPASAPGTLLDSRLSREQSERQRAAELIARKRKERMVEETPTTTASSDGGYRDLYNKVDVEAAHRRRRGDTQWNDRVRHWDGTQGQGRRW